MRRIVLNERRQRAEQDPLARLEIQALTALFPAGHPYHGAIIGSADDLAATTIADVDAFLGRHVQPGNATLVLVGDLPAETSGWIERHFGGLPAQPRPPARTVPQVTRMTELRVMAERPVGAAPAVLMAWPSPALDADGDAAADVLAEALERGGYVRLARAEGPPEAAEFQATQRSLPNQSVFFVRVIGRVGGDPMRLVAEVDRVLARVGEGALAEPAVRRARLRLAREHRSALQDLQDRAAVLAAEAAAGKPLGGEEDVQEWTAVTPAEVAASRVRCCGRRGAWSCWRRARHEGASVFRRGAPRAWLLAWLLGACASNQSWRHSAPDLPVAAPPVVAPRVERLGPSLLHVRRAGPTTAIGLVLRTGAEIDPPLASFALELLARGRDRAVEDALGELGGAIEVVWLGDGALLRVEVEASAWREALAIVTAAQRSAELTAEDVEALRRERQAALQRRDGDPAMRGLHLLQRRLARGSTRSGRRAAAGWSIEHVRKAQEQWLRARPALVVVGEVPGPSSRGRPRER
ncbi:insulinase family protein [Nannocystis pusilla]|uniref:M16 family metallopeptidase n=1 Tax=Nannocystis pusilla TaxID=889268 RepID=UPI003B81A196